MKKFYCDKCGKEGEKGEISEISFYANDFRSKGLNGTVLSYGRTDLTVTGKELCEKCAEELSKMISNFFVKQDANTKTEEPEAGKISRHKTHDGIKASGEVR